jgi:hypothetical protein
MTALLVKAIYDADGNVVALGELAVDDVAQLVGPLAFPDGTIQSTAATGNSGGSGVVSSPTPPDAPTEGQTWFETDSGRSYIWYVNPDTLVGCWIAVSQVDAVGGPQGPQGEVGPQGPQGIQGETGPAGPTGADSTVPGPQGPQGEAGAQGIGLRYVGRVATVAALPAGATHGDVYIADDTGNAHVWNGTTGVWDDAGKVVGATGPQGPAGLDGAQGPAGPVGADSTVPGPQGPAGADGAVGPQGPQGEVGPQGPQGAGGAAGWNSIGAVVPCSMLIGPNAGSVTTGTVYALGTGSMQISLNTAGPIGRTGTYGAGWITGNPIDFYTGQWAWHSPSYGWTWENGASSQSTTASIAGMAIKVAD